MYQKHEMERKMVLFAHASIEIALLDKCRRNLKVDLAAHSYFDIFSIIFESNGTVARFHLKALRTGYLEKAVQVPWQKKVHKAYWRGSLTAPNDVPKKEAWICRRDGWRETFFLEG